MIRVGDLETVLADALHFRSPVGVPAFGAGPHPFTPRPRGARKSAVSCLPRRGCQLSFISIAAWRPRTSGRGGNAAPPLRVSRLSDSGRDRISLVVVRTAYKCRAYPAPEQASVLNRTFGCVRVVWNRTLAWRHQRYHGEQAKTSFTQANAYLTAMKADRGPGVAERGVLGPAAAGDPAPAGRVHQLLRQAGPLPAVQVPAPAASPRSTPGPGSGTATARCTSPRWTRRWSSPGRGPTSTRPRSTRPR